MISLFPFQIKASEEIFTRYNNYKNSDNRPYETKTKPVPFYQALAAITGAGKTPILADAVTNMRLSMTSEPLVLWMSKGKAVVDQTYTNFKGKYAHLIDTFSVTLLKNLKPDKLQDGSLPILALATTGTFNQKTQEEGSLKIYQIEHDDGKKSLWDYLKERKTSEGKRRDLIIVYDEGHNLSDQQIDLLFDLEPESILVASATIAYTR